MNLNMDTQDLLSIDKDYQNDDQKSFSNIKDANTSNEVVKQQTDESCLHNTDANTFDKVVKDKNSFMPEIIPPSPPKMKYSQQPAQGFAETYKLPFPQTKFFVPFQVFNLFQNNEESLSSPNLRAANRRVPQGISFLLRSS